MIEDYENIGFISMLKIELLPTFSRTSIVVFSTLGTFSQNGSHIYIVQHISMGIHCCNC